MSNKWFDPDAELRRQGEAGQVKTFKSNKPPILSYYDKQLAEYVRTFGMVKVLPHDYKFYQRLHDADKIILSEEKEVAGFKYKLATPRTYREEEASE